MNVENEITVFSNMTDDHGADGEVGNKIPIHDIDVHPIGARSLELTDLLPQPAEVSGKDRWRYLYHLVRLSDFDLLILLTASWDEVASGII